MVGDREKLGALGEGPWFQVLAAGLEAVHTDSVWEFSWSRAAGRKARAPSWI